MPLNRELPLPCEPEAAQHNQSNIRRAANNDSGNDEEDINIISDSNDEESEAKIQIINLRHEADISDEILFWKRRIATVQTKLH